MADKRLGETFRRLAGGPPVWGAELGGSRAARGDGLAALIPDGVRREVGPLEEILPQAVRTVAREDDDSGILVFGSSYLVGAVLEEIGVVADDLVTFCRPPGAGD
jgi:folylpolyglutamate synthase/dihydropteroate synthase